MTPHQPLPRLWHIPKVALSVGEVVRPGRFGHVVVTQGAPGPYFFRESMLELVRMTRTSSPVSRFNCAFAFGSQEVAAILAQQSDAPYYEVEPVDPGAPISQHDMAWISYMGEPGTQPKDVLAAIEHYWRGAECPGEDPIQWEWLSSSGLRVIGEV
jgi:hypothetical protein